MMMRLASSFPASPSSSSFSRQVAKEEEEEEALAVEQENQEDDDDDDDDEEEDDEEEEDDDKVPMATTMMITPTTTTTTFWRAAEERSSTEARGDIPQKTIHDAVIDALRAQAVARKRPQRLRITRSALRLVHAGLEAHATEIFDVANTICALQKQRILRAPAYRFAVRCVEDRRPPIA